MTAFWIGFEKWSTIVVLAVSVLLISFGDLFVHLRLWGGWSPQAYVLVFLVCVFTIGVGRAMWFLRDEYWGYPRLSLRGFSIGWWLITVAALAGASLILYQWARSVSVERVEHLQPVFALTLFVLGTVLFSQWTFGGEVRLRVLSFAGVTAGLLFFVSSFLAPELFGTRHTSMYLISALIATLGVLKNIWLRFALSALILMGILSTASRTVIATAALVLLLAFLFDRGVRARYRLLEFAGFCLVYGAYFFSDDVLQFRFFGQRGDEGAVISAPALSTIVPDSIVEDGNILINTSGRADVWSSLASELRNFDLFWGAGGGASRSFLEETTATFTHAMNEPLALLFDYGILGLALWLIGLVAVGLASLVHIRSKAASPFVAVASIASLFTMGLTDIAWVTLGVLLPMAILLGSSIGEIVKTEHSESSGGSL